MACKNIQPPVFLYSLSRRAVNAFSQLSANARGAPRAQAAMQDSHHLAEADWIFAARNALLSGSALRALMATGCKVTGCKIDSPAALAEQQLCVLHYTLSIEASCAEMRRETAMGNAPHERLKEIMKFLTENGERLARVATSGMPLTDDLKARILSTFLTLMNLRENLDRANMRSSPGRTGAFR